MWLWAPNRVLGTNPSPLQEQHTLRRVDISLASHSGWVSPCLSLLGSCVTPPVCPTMLLLHKQERQMWNWVRV